MKQPTVDSTDDDVIYTTHDVEVNVNIVAPTKKVTKKQSTKVTTALKPAKTKDKTRVKVTRRLCYLCPALTQAKNNDPLFFLILWGCIDQ
jgi:hypothetical protein